MKRGTTIFCKTNTAPSPREAAQGDAPPLSRALPRAPPAAGAALRHTVVVTTMALKGVGPSAIVFKTLKCTAYFGIYLP